MFLPPRGGPRLPIILMDARVLSVPVRAFNRRTRRGISPNARQLRHRRLYIARARSEKAPPPCLTYRKEPNERRYTGAAVINNVAPAIIGLRSIYD